MAIDLTPCEIADALKSGERARLGREFRRLAETNLAPKCAKARRLRQRPRRTCSPERLARISSPSRNDSVEENPGCGAVQRPYQLFTVQQLPARFQRIRH